MSDLIAFGEEDDPYRVSVERRGDGTVVVVVEADVLATGGDTSEVEEECRRRGDAIRDRMLEMVRGDHHQ